MELSINAGTPLKIASTNAALANIVMPVLIAARSPKAATHTKIG